MVVNRACTLPNRPLRWASLLLGFAIVVVTCRTAILPRVAFAQRAEAERWLSVCERVVGLDRIKNGKAHLQAGKARHLAFAPMDVDDDADDDGDDDCLAMDDAALPIARSLDVARAHGGRAQPIAVAPREIFRAMTRGQHEARGPPSMSA